MHKSPYKLTLNPGGADSFVLVDWIHPIESVDLPEWQQRSRQSRYLEAAESVPRMEGNVEQSWQLTMRRDFENMASLVVGWEEFISALPVAETRELSVRVLNQTVPETADDAARTALEWRFAHCGITRVPTSQVIHGDAGGLSVSLMIAVTLQLSGRTVVGA